MINFSKLANDCQVPPSTVTEYVGLLEDTLVDFLIGLATAIEVKTSQKITARDFKGLKALEEEKVFKNYILVSQDPINTRDNNFYALYWETFLDHLWDDRFV